MLEAYVGIAQVPHPRAKGVRKAPEENPRHNKGKAPKNGSVGRRTIDASEHVRLSCVITSGIHLEFPQCGGCLTELTIYHDGRDEGPVVMCPKSPARLKGCEDADWVRVPSDLAKKCDCRGSAAVAAIREKEKEKETN